MAIYDLLAVLAVGAGLAGVIAGIVVTLTDEEGPADPVSGPQEIPELFRQQAVPADDLLVVIELLPANPGPNQLSILVRDGDSAPITPEVVRAVIRTGDGSPIAVELTPLHAPEHYVADGISLPRGPVRVEVEIVRPGEPPAVATSRENVRPPG